MQVEEILTGVDLIHLVQMAAGGRKVSIFYSMDQICL